MHGDAYYRLVIERPIPRKLVIDLVAAPVYHRLRRGNDISYHRGTFVPRARYEPGTVEHAHESHLIGLFRSTRERSKVRGSVVS